MKINQAFQEVGWAERPDQRKGHDRMAMARHRGRFAVFDGAGDPLASSLAARRFKRHSSRRRPPALEVTFDSIQHGVRRQHSLLVARAAAWNAANRNDNETIRAAARKTLADRDRIGRTTGSAIGLIEARSAAHMEYAHAGDSSIYVFDHDANRLDKITTDESGNLENGDVDASNFLGSPYHKLRQAGRLTLPRVATIALLTDGINGLPFDRSLQVTDERLGDILSAGLGAQDKAQTLVDASCVPDDASVIVIEHRR